MLGRTAKAVRTVRFRAADTSFLNSSRKDAIADCRMLARGIFHYGELVDSVGQSSTASSDIRR